MIKVLLLFAMIFLHIVDDYYLQGILASMKQKSWWEKNASDELYKHDYIMALFMHSFSWAFMIMIAPVVYILNNHIDSTNFGVILLLFVMNLYTHMITDGMKANQKKINLIQDQLIHLTQIFITWFFMIV